MRFSEFLLEAAGSLIGKTINGKKVTIDTKNEHWTGNFGCVKMKLTSLEGAPASIGGYFYCSDNQLTSLAGAPASVGVDFEGDFYCSSNSLTSLVGAPASVGGNFDCAVNQLTSLAGIHKIIKKMNGLFYANVNDIKSHVLGLLMIPGCAGVALKNEKVQKILNKYLPNTGGNQWVMQCQTELIQAGFREHAKL